jgi:hypothetical protein
MNEKISHLTNIVGFNVIDLDHVMDLLMSDKGQRGMMIQLE